MIQTLFRSPPAFFASLVAIIAAIAIHEFAHAWASDRLGDPTPRSQGRLTLNPLAHLDLIGTAALVLFGFGWGKPVQFDPYNLKNPRRDAMLISLAGPASNVISAAAAALLIRLIGQIWFTGLIIPFIVISIVLAIFNLVPIHPLDGGKIVAGLLPKSFSDEWEQIQRQWGMILLVFLIFPWSGTSPIFRLVGPVINVLVGLLVPAARYF